MKKGPYKMKYTNGKKADASAFPFKASPTKMMPGLGMIGGARSPGETKIRNDHRHTQDFIAEEGEQNEITHVWGREIKGLGNNISASDSLNTV